MRPKIPKSTKVVARNNARRSAKIEEIRRQRALEKEQEITKRTKMIEDTARKKNKQIGKTMRYESKQVGLSRRAEAKYKSKSTAAKTKTIARSSAVASTGISANLSEAEQSRNYAEQTKYNALLTGNYQGQNAIDPSKNGGNGDSNPLDINQSENDYYQGLF